MRRLTVGQRALAFGRLRGRSGTFRKARSKRDQRKKEADSPARVRCRQMDKRAIEELRQKIGCAALLENDGWKVDAKESTRRAIKYRRDRNIIIVIHEGRGWFDPLSTAGQPVSVSQIGFDCGPKAVGVPSSAPPTRS